MIDEGPIDWIDDDKAEAALALVEDIAYSLVDSDDDDVVIGEIGEQRSPGTPGRIDRGRIAAPAIVLRLSVHPSEIAGVIGRQGRTAHSLRVLLNAVGRRHGQRYMLEIVEQQPEDATIQPPADNFNR